MDAIQPATFSIPQPKVLKKIKRKQTGQGFVANCMTTMNGSNKMFTPRPATGTSSSLDRKRKTFNANGDGSPSLSNNKRQSLKILQLTAGNKKVLIGRSPTNDQDIKKLKNNLVRDSYDEKNERNVQKSTRSSKGGSKKSSVVKSGSKTSSVNIFVDSKNNSDDSSSEPEKQTNTNDEIYEMMTKDEAPESYWKEIAEERRKALASALDENKNLHNEINDLRTEYDQLKKVAEQAEYFAGIIEDLLGKKVDESSDEDVNTESNTDQTTSCRKRKRDDDDDDEPGLVQKGAKLYSSDEEDVQENVEDDDEDDEENSLFGSYV